MNLYCGSSNSAEHGVTLTGNGQRFEGAWAEHDHFWLLERVRPNGFLPHSRALSMVEDVTYLEAIGGEGGWQLEVEPAGEVTRHDFGWLQEITRLFGEGHSAQSQEIRAAVLAYWHGVAAPASGPWEYLCANATVLDAAPAHTAPASMTM